MVLLKSQRSMNNYINQPLFESRADATTKILDILPKTQMQDDEWLLISLST